MAEAYEVALAASAAGVEASADVTSGRMRKRSTRRKETRDSSKDLAARGNVLNCEGEVRHVHAHVWVGQGRRESEWACGRLCPGWECAYVACGPVRMRAGAQGGRARLLDEDVTEAQDSVRLLNLELLP